MFQSKEQPSVSESGHMMLNLKFSLTVELESFAVIHSPPDSGRYCKYTFPRLPFIKGSSIQSTGHKMFGSGLKTFNSSGSGAAREALWEA